VGKDWGRFRAKSKKVVAGGRAGDDFSVKRFFTNLKAN
jgi:hypothetical protein